MTLRPLKNLAIFTILKKTMDFFEVTDGFRLVEKGAEKTNPGALTSGPKGNEKKPIVFRSIGVMQRSRLYYL
jgi:hypothetical protein